VAIERETARRVADYFVMAAKQATKAVLGVDIA